MTRDERLYELLGAFGLGQIDRDSFWKRMAEAGLTDEDIDALCTGAREVAGEDIVEIPP